MIHRPVEQSDPIARPGFGEDIADVVINCTFADRELHRNFLVGKPRGDQLDDFQFPLREIAAYWAVVLIPRPWPDLASGCA